MVSFFYELNPIIQSLIAGIITFSLTTMGSALIFMCKSINKSFMDKLLSISAGIMLASSFFSLINPSIDKANEIMISPGIICSLGIVLGCIVLFLCDKLQMRCGKKSKTNNLILSMTIHNIPEGMAVGIAFGSACNGDALMSAISLAIGIGLQNFPEGSAISFPLYRDGYSKFKSFLIGALSAIVEPFGAVLGALIVMKYPIIMPILLAFAAGAMLYVIIVELIPEAMSNEKKEHMALYFVLGFIIMMFLDITLG